MKKRGPVSQTLNTAGPVMYTNWNDFRVQTQFMELVEDEFKLKDEVNDSLIPGLRADYFSF